MKKTAITVLLAILFFSCQQSAKENPGTANTVEKETTAAKPPAQNISKGKGALSFKLNGRLYETDPKRTKCWSTSNIPLAMLMAKGDGGLLVSWQMGYTSGQADYKLDGDKKGTINFTIDGKTYWTRSVTGDNFLDIKITEAKNKYNVILLSGTFEGVLEDKEGNKVQITEGKFITEDI